MIVSRNNDNILGDRNVNNHFPNHKENRMLEKLELMPGVNLRCYRENRFKQGVLSLQILRPMDASEASMNALLPAVLLRGTKQYPDMRAITARLDELYGASVNTMLRRVGDYQAVGLYCGFIDDRFALPGDAVLMPVVELLQQFLLDSPLEDEGFLPSFVESEKRNLISTIESELNDKRAYTAAKLMRLMCKEDSFGIPRLGEKQWVEAITPKELYRHYRRILRESPIEIFYVGSREKEQIARLLMPLLEKIPREYRPLPAQTGFRDAGGEHKRETMDVTQSKLCMGFTTSVTNRSEDFAAQQVLNVIYGGGMTSKLFQNVREKLSLCYSVGSGIYGAKGLMVVSAGIDGDKEDQARQEILAQLEACRQGDITQEELRCAKAELISSLRGVHDSPGAIENYYSTAAISGISLLPADHMAAIEKVTAADIARVAAGIVLHSSFILKGVGQ